MPLLSAFRGFFHLLSGRQPYEVGITQRDDLPGVTHQISYRTRILDQASLTQGVYS